MLDLLILTQIDEVDYGTTALYHWLRSRSNVGRDVIRDRVGAKKKARCYRYISYPGWVM